MNRSVPAFCAESSSAGCCLYRQSQPWDFPALGRGIVDYPKVFRLLRDHGFTGPYTLELEGTEDLTRTQEQQLEYVAESVGYLKSIGVMDVKA